MAGGLALLLPARGDLVAARDEMRRGRDALFGGDLAAARDAFARAEDAFARAGEAGANPLTAFVSSLPILGRTPDAVTGVSEAGVDVARAGQVVADGIERLPGGLAAIAPRTGAIPVEPMSRLARTLERATALTGKANRTASSIATSYVPGPLAGPVETFAEEVDRLDHTLRAGQALLRQLPRFLGAAGTRRYFFGAQNPAELRGTGGLLGAYAILTVRDGKLRLGPFQDASLLPNVDASSIDPPNPDYARMYDRYGGAGFWKNLNMTPDFPSAATAIERLYRRVEGVRLDGTIVADPAALALLVETTGPVRVPATDVSLEAEQVVPFLANEAYAIFEDPGARKRLLGAMAGTVLGSYLEGASEDPVASADAVVDAAADGHLLFHAADPDVQRAFEVAGIAGRLQPSWNDYLAVAVNNAGGNKLDFYVDRSIDYRIELLPGGVGEADVTVTYRNHSPDHGPPAYVIGPFPGVSKAGENVMIASTFCGRCRLHHARRDGRPTHVAQGTELGHTVVTNVVSIEAGGSATLSYGWTVPEAWEADGGAGSYRLTVQGQPTIRPTELTVEVIAPPGMIFTGASPGIEVDGDRATWSGTTTDLLRFEIELDRPLAVRLLEPVLPAV